MCVNKLLTIDIGHSDPVISSSTNQVSLFNDAI